MDGNPLLVLFDVGSAAWDLDRYKHELFEKSGIGIPGADIESNDAVIFGYMSAQFIAEVIRFLVMLCVTIFNFNKIHDF